MGVIENNSNEVMVWSLITLVYLVSLVILYLVVKRWERERNV
jgi:hypothetical protein